MGQRDWYDPEYVAERKAEKAAVEAKREAEFAGAKKFFAKVDGAVEKSFKFFDGFGKKVAA